MSDNTKSQADLSRDAYILAKVLVHLDELKKAGLVSGGYDIDRARCITACEAFERNGNPPATLEEIQEAAAFLFGKHQQ